MESIRENGKIRFVMLEGPSTYFRDGEIISGFDYDLAGRFARTLGVKLKIIAVARAADIIESIRRGQADIGASGTAFVSAIDPVIAGPAYQQVAWHVIYNRHTRRPGSLDSLKPGQLAIAKGNQFSRQLEKLAQGHPQLTWDEYEGANTRLLLELLNQGEIDLTITDSITFAYYQQLYPDTRIAFDLTDPQPATWIYRKSPDNHLHNAVNDFFHNLEEKGDLDRINERNRGHLDKFDYVDSRTFVKRVFDRLPLYRALFKEAADNTGIDWRLLAALSYQESHWDPQARSSTGVRGLMMLTRTTAKQVGIDNRLEPGQSISGGATYLHKLRQRIPSHIPEPDRTWFAIAAYNVGFGHLEDARILTQKQGGNPDYWIDVKDRLPLLRKEEWFAQTKHGFARGYEPVSFVSHIRKYYDMLRLLLKEEKIIKPETEIPAIAALFIDSPVL
jgi:membrane-bound lytic murein transglycosylase F